MYLTCITDSDSTSNKANWSIFVLLSFIAYYVHTICSEMTSVFFELTRIILVELPLRHSKSMHACTCRTGLRSMLLQDWTEKNINLNISDYICMCMGERDRYHGNMT